jgi:hypothetical protein
MPHYGKDATANGRRKVPASRNSEILSRGTFFSAGSDIIGKELVRRLELVETEIALKDEADI